MKSYNFNQIQLENLLFKYTFTLDQARTTSEYCEPELITSFIERFIKEYFKDEEE